MGVQSGTQRRSARRLGLTLASAVALVVPLLAITTTTSSATHVTPTLVNGNSTCSTLVPGSTELTRVGSGTNGTSVTSAGVTVSYYGSSAGQLVDWSSLVGIDAVFVKGGNKGLLYVYNPSATADTGLHSPVNSSGNYAGVSHISFCYTPEPSTSLSVTSTNPSPATIHAGDAVTIYFSETNDGDFPLTAVNVTADNGCTPAKTGGDTVNVGVLDVGETWTFSCTTSSLSAANNVVTANATGTTPGGVVVRACNAGEVTGGLLWCDPQERTTQSVTVLNPSTVLTLNASTPANLKIHSGDSVDLTFAETNDAVDGTELTNVFLTTNAGSGCTPVKVAASDTGTQNVLSPNETWLFTCTVTNITSDVTITAYGHGQDGTGDDITWCADPLNPGLNVFCDQGEIEAVNIDVLNPSTVLTLSSPAPAGLVVPPGGSVLLTFAEENDAVDGTVLDQPRVTTDYSGCAEATYLSGDTVVVNGDLDPGETFLYTCQVTNVTSSLTVTAIGHGIDATGDDITWCADILNAGANVTCDQAEIEVVNITLAPTNEGCSPGYWKNHPASWAATGYSPNQTLSSVFSMGLYGSLGSSTLMEALSFKGSGPNGPAQSLLRAATSALLNSSHPGIDYDLTTASVISMTNAALASGVTSATQATFASLEEPCPIS